ncbi:hypothetical protein HYG86_01395 [Alkalicella caledoniensis]|uniref:NERD domain-containing protein n=1 Tax=Alkalicella caledoniensis TaxID=2731377 RepID=A0A7G9W4A3_ALKCA|nr:hypothetical protein [Alkalicella caledoniensis]QNO13515.1 hypothetical protein HYG86_01395 [Alkalicella caledoniensis]
MDIVTSLKQLSNSRKVFHSEADFQFALAWEIQKLYPDARIRLEYCPASITPNIHIDILVIIDNMYYPIELKYKTLGCNKTFEDEVFKLKNHGAQDLGRYDFLKDVQRVEQFSKELPRFKAGYSIFLTNDQSYWKDSGRKETVYYQFRLSEGLEKAGIMCWASHSGEGTIKGRETPIALDYKYTVKWEQYCKLDDSRGGTFNYLVFPLEKDHNL